MSRTYLLDTSFVSLFAPRRPALDESVVEWIRRRDDGLFLSAITVLEIEQGIRKLFRSGGDARAKRLEDWLGATLADYGDRVLPADAAVALLAGQMSDAAVASGVHPGLPIF